MHFTLICMLRTIAAWRRDLRQNGGYACACSTQFNYVSLLLDRLLRPVRAAARTRSRCLAQVRHPQDSGIL